jgi:hypothetical protein
MLQTSAAPARDERRGLKAEGFGVVTDELRYHASTKVIAHCFGLEPISGDGCTDIVMYH